MRRPFPFNAFCVRAKGKSHSDLLEAIVPENILRALKKAVAIADRRATAVEISTACQPRGSTTSVMRAFEVRYIPNR